MSTTIQHTCRPAEDGTGVRLLNLEHHRDCNVSGCPGCLPCVPEHGHCRRCLAEHLDPAHPATCPRCIARTRNDLLELVDKIVTAHTEHVHRSINSLVFMVAGPATDYERHSYVHASATEGRLCKCRRRGLPGCLGDVGPTQGPVCERYCLHPSCRAVRRGQPVCPDAAFILEDVRDDTRHPITVLSAWALTAASVLGHEPPLEPTLADTQRYLLTHLTRLAQYDLDVFDFDAMAHHLSTSHRWLEDLLRLGHRPDQAGWCPMCKRERLVKDWDPRDEGTPYTPDRDTKHYADRWVCPNPACAQVYQPEEYRERLDVMYLESADRLPAAELAQRLRVAPSTVRRWASETKRLVDQVDADGRVVGRDWQTTPPLLRSCGRDATGRKLFRVADGERVRDTLRKDAS